MALDVEIANIDESGNTLDIAVFVTTDTTETIEYELNINDTGTGGTVTRSGTLVGGAGSFVGDSNTENVSFGIGDTTGGTVTATITAPEQYVGPEYTDQSNWGSAGSGQPGGPNATISGCNATPTSDGDLSVTYTLAPTVDERVEQEVTVRVDGSYVNDETHTVPRRGGEFEQIVPAVNLPTGTDMPVEVGLDGNFSDCGTVTVGGVADGSIAVSGCSVSASGGTVTAEATLSGTAPTGEVDVALISDRSGVGGFTTAEIGPEINGETVEIATEPNWADGDHAVTIEVSAAAAGGDVLASDTTTCGSVTLSSQAGQQPPQELSCGQLQQQYGDLMAAYGTPGEVFSGSDLQTAFTSGDLTERQTQALQQAFEQGCKAPGGGPPLKEIAIGAAVVGAGYAASRFL